MLQFWRNQRDRYQLRSLARKDSSSFQMNSVSKFDRYKADSSQLNEDFYRRTSLQDQIKRTIPVTLDRYQSSRLVPVHRDGVLQGRGIQSSKEKGLDKASVTDHKINIKKKLAAKEPNTHKPSLVH